MFRNKVTLFFKSIPYNYLNRFQCLALTSIRNASFEIKEEQTMIERYTVNYTIIGSGKHHVLLLPGALGTMQSDFASQFSGLDKSKFSLVSWDPIGYGKSRPPEREFVPDFYVNDANIVAKLMERQCINKYSVVGWSDGAITGLILAAMLPMNVHKLVLLAPMAYVTQEDVDIYEDLKDISKWTPKLRLKLEAVYGAENLERLWKNYCQYFIDLLKTSNGEVCQRFLSSVRCPTLVMHGQLDTVVPITHGQFVAKHIKGARFHPIPNGKHNFQYRFADEVNTAIDEFLTNN